MRAMRYFLRGKSPGNGQLSPDTVRGKRREEYRQSPRWLPPEWGPQHRLQTRVKEESRSHRKCREDDAGKERTDFRLNGQNAKFHKVGGRKTTDHHMQETSGEERS